VLCLVLTPLAGVSAQAFTARDFSADIVIRDAAGLAAAGTGGRLFVANRTVRIETSEVAGYFLVYGETGAALFVRPAQRLFMDAKQSSRLTQLFVPIDPKDPCRQWRAAAKNADSATGWSCDRTPRTPDERGTIEYHVNSTGQGTSQLWIDPLLEFPVKLRAADGSTIELEHIRVEAQPAALFEIPPGFQKMDPQGLIDRIKRSDVWAGQP
jgi:hypothetical protein